jgi:hypothetical protein
VRANEGAFRATLEKLKDLPIVGDVRGDGYFYGIELVKDKETKETFSEEESEVLLRGFLSRALFDAGLYCRADDRGDPVIQLAPPLRASPTTSTARPAPRSSPTAAEVWERAGLVCKVKEPQPESEFAHLRADLVLFTYLHLAAYPEVADALLAAGTTGIAYETVQLADGALPLLAPMSEVAGRMAVQVGAHFLERHNGGRGVLLGGVPGVRPARVVVLGAGNVGWNAAWMAAGLEAEVTCSTRTSTACASSTRSTGAASPRWPRTGARSSGSVAEADLVIGAVLVAGGRAPWWSPRTWSRHEARRRHRRHRHRPGRLRRDLPRDHPRRPGLRGPRRAALRRGQHARRGAQHLHPRAHQRHAALPGRARRLGVGRGGPARRRRWPTGSTPPAATWSTRAVAEALSGVRIAPSP